MHARYCEGVEAISRDLWQACLPGHGEDWTYFRLLQDVPPPGFELGAIVVERDGHVIAFTPVFRTTYRFDTSLQGGLRRMTNAIHAVAPRLLSMDLLSIGTPLSEHTHIGFAPALSPEEQDEAVRAMLDALKAHAKHTRVPLIAVKGLDTTEADRFAPLFAESGYARVTSIPDVVLALPYANIDGYISSLPDGTGRYIVRKWRSAAKVEIEYPRTLEGAVKDEINRLYNATLAQSRWDYDNFGPLHPDYFATVLERMGDRAHIMLCRVDGRLLSFQLFIVGDNAALAKGIGMQYPEARDYNLYFLNWKEMIEYCIAHRIPRISMAGTTYATKLLIGGALHRQWVYFRFRSPFLNKFLPRLAPAFDFEAHDPELKCLKDKAPGKDGEAAIRAARSNDDNGANQIGKRKKRVRKAKPLAPAKTDHQNATNSRA